MQKPGPDGAAGTARPLSVAPAQWEECPLLAGFYRNGTARAESERRRKTEEATRGREGGRM